MEFPDRLAALRRERGLTQVELAERAGIHPSQLHRYEAGTAQSTLDVIRRLSVSLAVSSDSLLFADDARTIVEGRLATALEMAAYLPERDQYLIAEVIDAFVAARVVKNRPNKRRGPLPRRLRDEH
jgi:transcriptional regulator with XRE-family HTH domain